jgi:hypothetical protein
MKVPFLRKLLEPRIWGRIVSERFSEPLHLNFLSLLVAVAGSFPAKVYFDLVARQHNAFCLLQAAHFAKRNGYSAFTAIEFGVANGAGLLNMAAIAARVTRATGIKINLVGFDTGRGMPPPIDFRDHPDCYNAGDFPMQDHDRLRGKLPPGAQLIIGQLEETVAPFVSALRSDAPIGYVVVDVDYYSSTKQCLEVFTGPADLYLPEILLYLDDVTYPQHNPWQGEYLAIREFNDGNELRKACPYNLLRAQRLFKNARWIDQVYLMHVLDHVRKRVPADRPPVVLGHS